MPSSPNKKKRDFEEFAPNSTQEEDQKSSSTTAPSTLLPVTILSGFLGAGKTTLLRHILHTKATTDGDGQFKCAVIVNDVASLNIDKSLIESTGSVIQPENDTEEEGAVIAMQNGCVCCSLQHDLVKQIVRLATSGRFEYCIIECSGVAEPAQIAKLFGEDCEDGNHHDQEHDEGGDHKTIHLSDVARLDTCVTVVDVTNMLIQNQDSILYTKNTTGNKESLSQLLLDQIEHANIIVLNKIDLINDVQLEEITDRMKILVKPQKAKVLTCRNSEIAVMEVVNTQMYDPTLFDWTRFIDDVSNATARVERKDNENKKNNMPNCCVESQSKGKKRCCNSNSTKMTLYSDRSNLLLSSSSSGSTTTRHSQRFGITSFVYRARRPFHPSRLRKEFIDKFFIYQGDDDDDDGDDHEEEEEEGEDRQKEKGKEQEEQQEEEAKNDDTMETNNTVTDKGNHQRQPPTDNNNKPTVEEMQTLSREKQRIRNREIGDLLRCKGFLWITDSHDVMVTISQAGSLVTMDYSGPWTALNPKAYTGTKSERLKLCKDWDGQWKDRRQEVVFIGQNLKHKYMQALLDECQLDDDEFEMGVDYWKATLGDYLLEINPEEEDDDGEMKQ